MNFNTSTIRNLILDRLNSDIENMQKTFENNLNAVGTKFLTIDNLLPTDIVTKIYESFLTSPSTWRELKSFRERKLTTKNYDAFPSLLGEVAFAFQDPEVIRTVEKITQIKQQVGDPGMYAGGMSMMRRGDFLEPHIDNSHDQERKVYRRLNLLYYVTPDWKLEDGGHLELWDDPVKKKVTLESKFNRLILMETHHRSWHSVSKVQKPGGMRCCISNYYFSPISPLGYEYFHVTSFSGRPEDSFKRALCKADNFIRLNLRRIKQDGFGEKDVYSGKGKSEL